MKSFVTLVLTVAAGFIAYNHWYSPAPEIADQGERKSAPLAEVAPASAAAAQDADWSATGPVIATVYECNGEAGRTLTDKPCADDAKVRPVRAPNGMNPTPVPDAPGLSQEPTGASFAVVIPKLETCEELEADTKLVNERLHAKNLPREYETKLRETLREYEEARVKWKCRF